MNAYRSSFRQWSAAVLRLGRTSAGRVLARLHGAHAEVVREGATVAYSCNVCGGRCRALPDELEREAAQCPRCGSNMRNRAVVHHLSVALFGQSLRIDEFPASARELAGIGMSDSDCYAARLAKRLRYTNTYYHKEPRLDVLAPPPAYLNRFRFIISSDVLEHVAPPIERAFANLHAMLVPGGILVLTVPFVVDGETVEHFPELHEYRIERDHERSILVNRTRDGRSQTFRNLVFHGGPGTTLEMRVFSESALLRHLRDAGFSDIRVHREPVLATGIDWKHPWSVPITARA